MAAFKIIKTHGGQPKTSGRFESREKLESFVTYYGMRCIPIKIIVYAAGCSRAVVDKILNGVDIRGYFNRQVKKMGEMLKVYRIENKHLREENKKLVAQLKALKWEWPAETRIEAIGQNGNNGEHYAKLNDSHTKGENQHAKESK